MRMFWLKLLLLTGIVSILHVAYYFFFVGKLNCYPKLATRVMRQVGQAHDILYFGDSVMCWVAPTDQSSDPISVYLQQLIEKRKITAIFHPGFDSETYLAISQFMMRQEQPLPKTIIIPINLRSFSPNWPTQFRKERFIWTHDNLFLRVIFKPLDVFKAFRTDHSQEKFGLYKSTAMKTNNCFDDYSYALDKANAKLHALIELTKLYKGKNTEVIFYATPINYLEGQKCGGTEVVEKFRQNVRFVSHVLREQGFELLDWSEALPSNAFFRGEHLNEAGRKFIAQKLSRYL